MESSGLRARKKLATRAAIHFATLDLIGEHGLEHVTVADICSKVDISPRTFFNYFSCKEEAAVGWYSSQLDEISDYFVDDSKNLFLLDLIERGLRRFFEDSSVSREDLAKRSEIVRNTPALLPWHLASYTAFENLLAAAIRNSSPSAPDLYVTILSGVIVTIVRNVIALWIQEEERSLEDLLADGFGIVKSGFQIEDAEGQINELTAK